MKPKGKLKASTQYRPVEDLEVVYMDDVLAALVIFVTQV